MQPRSILFPAVLLGALLSAAAQAAPTQSSPARPTTGQTATGQTATGQTTTGQTTAARPTTGQTATGQTRTTRIFTLAQAISAAESNQPLVLQAESSVAAAQDREAEATSAYLPSVVGIASYDHMEPQEGMVMDFEPTLPIDIQAPLTPQNIFNVNVGASELIYSFGRRKLQVRIAESGVDAARIGVEQIRASIAYQTAQAFYAALFLGSEIKVIDGQLDTLNQHLDETKKREETGSSTHYDVLTTEVRVAAVKSQRIAVAGLYAKETIALRELMGLAGDETFGLSGDFSPSTEAADASGSLQSAMSQRPDVEQSLEAEKQAELGASLAKLGNMPSISTQLEAGFKNGQLTFSNTDVNKMLPDWNFGLVATVPIFDGLLTRERSAEAEAKLGAVRKGTAAIRRSVTTQVLQAIQDVESSRDQIANSLAQLAQAQEALNMAKVQYEIGVGTNLEYLDSQTSLEVAKLNNLSAVYQEVMSQLRLKQAIGARIWETS